MRFSRLFSIVCLAFAVTFFASAALAIGTTDDHNAGSQATDANIHLTCSAPGGTCYATYYRVDGNEATPLTAPFPDVWVANQGSASVSRVNPMTNTVSATITVGTNPRGVGVDSNGNVWVA
ncbi:MAG: hypothetical protein WC602_04920, partial [archaeon]